MLVKFSMLNHTFNTDKLNIETRERRLGRRWRYTKQTLIEIIYSWAECVTAGQGLLPWLHVPQEAETLMQKLLPGSKVKQLLSEGGHPALCVVHGLTHLGESTGHRSVAHTHSKATLFRSIMGWSRERRDRGGE